MSLLILILIWPILRCESLTERITKEPIMCDMKGWNEANVQSTKLNVRQCIEPTW